MLLKCTKCKNIKPDTDFGKDGSRIGRGGFSYRCLLCASEHKKDNHKRHKTENNNKAAQWYKLNKDKHYKDGVKWQHQNKPIHRAILNRWERKRLKNDPLFALSKRVRVRILNILRSKNLTKIKSSTQIIGCSWEELFKYLGPRPIGAELEHICPVDQAKTEQEIYLVNHYSNLRWLSKEENSQKSNNATPEAVTMCKTLLKRDWIYDDNTR